MELDGLADAKRLATDAMVDYVNDDRVYNLAKLLEVACEKIESLEADADKAEALREELHMSRDEVETLKRKLAALSTSEYKPAGPEADHGGNLGIPGADLGSGEDWSYK